MPKASHLYRSGTISRKTDKPTHPEKLLWAANGFQESRYYVSVKQMWKKKKWSSIPHSEVHTSKQTLTDWREITEYPQNLNECKESK